MSKVSEYTSASSAGATDLFYLVQGSTSKKIPGANLAISITQMKSAPATTKGATGDKLGMIAFDSNYFYYCTANYTTGVADIWKRVGLSTW